MYKIALRELKRNSVFFGLCFGVFLLSTATSQIGMRILQSIDIINKNSEFYEFKNLFFIESIFLTTASILLCTTVILLFYAAFPKEYKRELENLRELGVTKGGFVMIFLLQTVIYAIPAIILGITIGEILAVNHMQLFIGTQIPLTDSFGSIYRIFLIYILVIIFVCYFTSATIKNKQRTRRAIRLLKFKADEKFPSCKLGLLSFLRRKRPVASIVILSLCIISLTVFGGILSFAQYYNSTPMQSSIYDAAVSIREPKKETCDTIFALLKDCEFSSWRVRYPKRSTGFSRPITLNIISDGDFDDLTLTTLPTIKGNKPAILQNCAYDASNHFEKITFVADTAQSIFGIADNVSLQIVGFIDEVPLKFSLGFTEMTVNDFRLFVRESDFPEYEASDRFIVQFSGETIEHTQILKQQMSEYGFEVNDTFINKNVFDFSYRFLYSSFFLFSPVLILALIMYFVRDFQSRRDESELLRSLGMTRKKLFIYLAVDYLLLISILFTLMTAISVAILIAIQFDASGYYLPFYVPSIGFIICGISLFSIALLFILIATTKKSTTERNK